MSAANPPPKLLISARDAGAAFHLCEIVRHLNTTRCMDVAIVATPPAYDIFRSSGFAVHEVTTPSTTDPASSVGRALLEQAERYIGEIRPDALLVGLSGPDCGIDEALVASASGIPTYAVQDFWGDVNPGFGALPDTYFVLDTEAAALTCRRAHKNVVVTGSARHGARQHDHAQLRRSARSLWNVADRTPVLVYFGQPLHHFSGYAATLEKTAATMFQIDAAATIRYRPHPKESAADRMRAVEILAASNVPVELDTSPAVEDALCGADLCCTCFSSCGIDHAYLSRSAAEPLAIMLYLLFETDVQTFYTEFSRLNDIPLSRMGLTTTVREKTGLETIMRASLTDVGRTAIWTKIHDTVNNPVDASARIAETILDGIRNRQGESAAGQITG